MLKHLFLIASIFILSGCVTGPPKPIFHSINAAANANKYPVAIDEFDDLGMPVRDFMEFDPIGAYTLCMSYYYTRDHKNLRLCHKDYAEFAKKDKTIYRQKLRSDYLLSESYMAQGQYDKAITGYESLINNSDSPGGVLVASSMGLSQALYLNGEHKRASELALAFEDEVNGSFLAAITRGHKGMDTILNTRKAEMAIVRNDFKKAHEYLSTGTGIGIGSLFTYIEAAGFTGVNRTKAEMYDYYEHAAFRELYLKAYVALRLQRLSEAKEHYTKLIKHRIFKSQSRVRYTALYDLAAIEVDLGNHAESINFLKQAIDVVESERSTIGTETSKISFVGNKQDIYGQLVSQLIKQGDYQDAFEYAERGKSRALVDMLATKKQFASKKQGVDVTKLISALDDAEQRSNVISISSSATRGIQLANKHKLAIESTDKELASLVTVNKTSLSDIQQNIKSNETLVEYYGSGEKLFGFVVTRNSIQAVPLDVSVIKQRVNVYRSSLSDRNSQNHKQAARALYDAAVKPLSAYIKSSNVTVVPHGALHYAPFAALYDGKQYMVDKYQLRVLPSASVLSFLDKSVSNKQGSLLSLGNPDLGNTDYDLPGAEQEAVQVSKLVTNAKVLLRKNATETALKKYGPEFKRIHFAMHGQFDDKKPLQSGLLMTPDSQNDGRLTVSELYELNLNTDLVTLSACQTALGETANGDDVIGFTRGFLYAGAQSIVSSLWEVDDAATRELMVSFYTNLKNENKGAALKRAQQKVKKMYSHPYYWAAFQLTGKS